MTRFRTAALVAGLTAAVLAPTAGTTAASEPTATAAACTWQGFKLTNLRSTTCVTAKKALKYYYGGGGSSQGYRCRSTAASGYRSGKCTKSDAKSFKFSPR